MNLEDVFSFVNTLAVFSWIALFVFYSKKWIYKVLFSGILVILSVTYIIFISQGLYGDVEGGFSSLAGVKALFQNDEALLAGWIHYLAFDLFVGMWISKDSWELKINRWLLLTCLLFTFMFGPVGLLLYILIRMVKTNIPIQSM